MRWCGWVRPTVGKLTHVQPIGADPKAFDDMATEVYGVGAFLLAGAEVYRLAVVGKALPRVVRVDNPADFRRACETVAMDLHAAGGSVPVVMDGLTSRILNSQVVGRQVLFQVDLVLGAGWSRSGDFPDAAAWQHEVRQQARKLKSPLRVTEG